MYNPYPIFSGNLSEPLLSLYLPCLAMSGGSRNGGSYCGLTPLSLPRKLRSLAYRPEI